MGRIHQIKKSFERVTTQDPLTVGYHRLTRGVSLYIGKRHDGTFYLIYFGRAYKALVVQLIQAYGQGRGSS